MGNYTVTLPDDQAVVVDWTHKDVDAGVWRGLGLEAPVWGQEQLLVALSRQREANRAYEAANTGTSNSVIAPEPDWLTIEQKDALLDTANRAMMDTYGFTRATLVFFDAEIIVSETRDEDCIEVVYSARSPEYSALDEQLGRYFVTLKPDSGEVVRVYWSEEAQWEDKAYTSSDWGSAPAFHAKLLPWALELHERVDKITARYGLDPFNLMTVYDLSLMDIGAYDQLFSAVGFPRDRYYRTIPSANDIPCEQAFATARQVLIEDFGLTEEKLDKADFYAEQFVNKENIPIYFIFYYFNEDGYDARYDVEINAHTGEIVYVDVATGGDG
jgi:hypothetical protein